MSETQATAPINHDDAAFLDDVPATKEIKTAPSSDPETPEAIEATRLKTILPALSDTDRKAVLTSLRNTRTLDWLLAHVADPVHGSAIQDNFRTQIALARAQTEETSPLKVDAWLKEFLASLNKHSSENQKIEAEKQITSLNSNEKTTRYTEDKIDYTGQNKDVQTFDAILKKHPEIVNKLKAQGIDLDAEKRQERDKLTATHPGMSGEEMDTRCAITVYLRHQDAIYAAAPDDSIKQELNASFEHLRAHARSVGIPYQESIRQAVDVLPSYKAAIMATTGATLDTRMIRVGRTLYFDTPADHVQQLWTLRPGERPEKSIEISGGPRIKIATALEVDNALALKKQQALGQIAEITAWPAAQTHEGYAASKKLFPAHLEASK